MNKKGKIKIRKDPQEGQKIKQRLQGVSTKSKKALDSLEEVSTNQNYLQSNNQNQNKSSIMKSLSSLRRIIQKTSSRLKTENYSNYKSFQINDLSSSSSFDIPIPTAGGMGGIGSIGGIGGMRGTGSINNFKDSMKDSNNSNKEGDSSGFIKIPQAGNLKSKLNNNKEDSSKIQDSKPLIPVSESIWSVKVPKPHIFGKSLSTIEDQIISGQGLSSLQIFRQFTKIDLLFDDKLKTNDVLQAFSFLICQLLGMSQSGRQKLLEIKDASFTMNFEPKLYESQWKTIKTHGGDDIDNMQIKRLFLQYMIKIFEDEKSVPILEWYFVLADILSMIIREFIRLRIGVIQGQKFEIAARSQQAGNIYPFYQEPLGLKYERQGNQHIFHSEGRRLIIEEAMSDGYLSWIQ